METVVRMIKNWQSDKNIRSLVVKMKDFGDPVEIRIGLTSLPEQEEREAYASLEEITQALLEWKNSLVEEKKKLADLIQESAKTSAASIMYTRQSVLGLVKKEGEE